MTYKVAGSIRFNTATSKMEIYNGEKWWQIDSTSPSEETGGTRDYTMVVILHLHQIEIELSLLMWIQQEIL